MEKEPEGQEQNTRIIVILVRMEVGTGMVLHGDILTVIVYNLVVDLVGGNKEGITLEITWVHLVLSMKKKQYQLIEVTVILATQMLD